MVKLLTDRPGILNPNPDSTSLAPSGLMISSSIAASPDTAGTVTSADGALTFTSGGVTSISAPTLPECPTLAEAPASGRWAFGPGTSMAAPVSPFSAVNPIIHETGDMNW